VVVSRALRSVYARLVDWVRVVRHSDELEHCILRNRNGMTLGSRRLTRSRWIRTSLRGCHVSKADRNRFGAVGRAARLCILLRISRLVQEVDRETDKRGKLDQVALSLPTIDRIAHEQTALWEGLPRVGYLPL
jgi:hypothetical protein